MEGPGAEGPRVEGTIVEGPRVEGPRVEGPGVPVLPPAGLAPPCAEGRIPSRLVYPRFLVRRGGPALKGPYTYCPFKSILAVAQLCVCRCMYVWWGGLCGV